MSSLAELESRLARLSAVVDFDEVLKHGQSQRDIVEYYEQSSIGYRLFHSAQGAIHMALNADGQFSESGYTGQAEIIDAEIAAGSKRHILELACGKGYNLKFLASRHPEAVFTGVDITRKHIRSAEAATKGIGNVECILADFAAVPKANHEFDLVFSVESFCHALDVDEAFREVARLAAAQAKFIVIDAWRTRPEAQLAPSEILAARLVERSMAVGHGHTLDSWLKIAAPHGFQLQRTADLSAQVMPNLKKFERLAGKYLEKPKLSRVLGRLLPHRLIGNVVAGYLMPSTVSLGIHQYVMVELDYLGS
jgi:SAM-dependent methyltransferase